MLEGETREEGSGWRVGERVLGLYDVTAVHGEGGMGLVHRVRHLGWGLDLAVKSPRPELLRGPADRERFVREAETWVDLGLHPHVCACHYVRTVAGVPRVFAEYVDGGSLRAWIDDRRLHRGSPEEVLARMLDIAIQMAWGLAHAHQRGVVHQDVKPGNVLLGADGVAKITDFGLARARRFGADAQPASFDGVPPGGAENAATALLTQGGLTPAYASPEQVRGAPLDGRTDVFSLAVSILEMFTGEVSWGFGPAAGPALAAYRLSPPPPPPLPSLPGRLAALLERCLRDDRAGRPARMTVVAAELAAVYAAELGRPYPRRAPTAAELRADELTNRAMSLLDLGRSADAEALLAEAHEADPQHPEAVHNLGLLRWRSGGTADDMLLARLSSALESADSGSRWRAELSLAAVHLERGDPQAALPPLARARRTAPDDVEVAAALEAVQSATWDTAAGRLVRTLRGTEKFVHAVALTPDGRRALSGGEEGEVLLWDAESGRLLGKFAGHEKAVHAVALTADGGRALTGDHSGRVLLWDTRTGRVVRELAGHTGSVRSCVFGADQRTAVTGGWDGTVRWWEAATGRCLRVLEPSRRDARHPASVGVLALAGDGHTLLVGAGNVVGVWDLTTGRCLRTLDGCHEPPAALAPDGRHALTGGDRGLIWWDLSSGERVRAMGADPRGTVAAAVAPDGRHAVTGAVGGALRLWDLTRGRCLWTVPAHLGVVSSLTLSADGRRALTGSDTVRLWQLPAPGAYTAPYQICRPRSHGELALHQDRVDRLLEAAERARRQHRYADAIGLVADARALPGHERDERVLAAWHLLSLCCVRVGVRGAWPAGAVRVGSHVYQAEATADGRRALCADLDGLRLWDLDATRPLRAFTGHAGDVRCVSLAPDQRRALSGGADGTVRLWDLADGRCLRVIDGYCGRIESVRFSPDGLLAFAGGADGSVRCWELDRGRLLAQYRPHGSATQALCPSADGRLVLSGGRGDVVMLWDLEQALRVREFHESNVNPTVLKADIVSDARLTPDGRLAVTANSGGRVRVWNIADGRLLHVADQHATDDGWANVMTAVTVSADSRFALAANWDTAVRLLDLWTGRRLRTLAEHTNWVTTVHLSADGRYAVSGGTDGTLRRWEIDWELEPRRPVDWDEGARPYLNAFLDLRTRYRWQQEQGSPGDVSLGLGPVTSRLARTGPPVWGEDDVATLLRNLGRAGYGWLRPEGVRAELERAAAARESEWEGDW
ncbi:WD40 repeat domain-containing serine/threonine protein kinase [Streptomyces sp. NPDC001156]